MAGRFGFMSARSAALRRQSVSAPAFFAPAALRSLPLPVPLPLPLPVPSPFPLHRPVAFPLLPPALARRRRLLPPTPSSHGAYFHFPFPKVYSALAGKANSMKSQACEKAVVARRCLKDRRYCAHCFGVGPKLSERTWRASPNYLQGSLGRNSWFRCGT